MKQTVVYAGGPGFRIKVTQTVTHEAKATDLSTDKAHLVNLEKAA